MAGKVAILGGGITGLTAAYYEAKKGNAVILFEKEPTLGGLAGGFKNREWNWPLERTYHHLFSNDYDIANFAKEIDFHHIFFKNPLTASAYQRGEDTKQKKITLYSFTTPTDFFKFPLLSLSQKIRSSAVLALLKLSPFWRIYEQMTAQEFLQKTMGEEVWNVLWQELFRKKFGKYAGNILASFIWSRIKKRTRALGYIKGGFQTFIDFLEKRNTHLQVIIKKGHAVSHIEKKGRSLLIDEESFDRVISTLPTPIIQTLGKDIFPSSYLARLSRLRYLHALNLILETDEPLLEKIYWLNVMIKNFPFTVLVQHTNFIDKKNYNNRHLLYIGNYLEREHILMRMDKTAMVNYFTSYLKKIATRPYSIINAYLFKGPFAQPIFDKDFVKNKPDFETPVKNFYIANLDMTYPHDRGTNYAVKLGKEVVSLI